MLIFNLFLAFNAFVLLFKLSNLKSLLNFTMLYLMYNLTDCTHYISLSNLCSDFAPVHSGVTQGSVLGPILFTMHIKPLSAIIDSHSIIHHSFADDLQQTDVCCP